LQDSENSSDERNKLSLIHVNPNATANAHAILLQTAVTETGNGRPSPTINPLRLKIYIKIYYRRYNHIKHAAYYLAIAASSVHNTNVTLSSYYYILLIVQNEQSFVEGLSSATHINHVICCDISLWTLSTAPIFNNKLQDTKSKAITCQWNMFTIIEFSVSKHQ